MNIFGRALLRLGRVGISLAIAAATAFVTHDERWVWLAPVLSAVGKAIREMTGNDKIPL